MVLNQMKHQVKFPTRDEDVRKICRTMLGLSKSSTKELTKEELITICKGRGYLK